MRRPRMTHKEPKMAEDFSGAISSIDEIIDDARNGKMYILVDAED